MNQVKLEIIEKQMFENARNLKWFSAKENKLKELTNKSFGKIDTLETIILSKNEISKIEGRTFVNILNLKEIRLDSNKLSSIPPHSFPGKVETFDLKNNKNLKFPKDFFAVGTFKNLKSVDLSSNECGKKNFDVSKDITELTKVMAQKVCSGGDGMKSSILLVLVTVFIGLFRMIN